jgi:HSP20 family protein
MFDLTPWRKQRKDSGALTTRPDHPLRQIRDEFDDLFNRFFAGLPELSRLGDGGQRFWGVDIDETDKDVVVRAEAPGFEPEDFDIHVNGNVLTIRAEQKQESGQKKDGYQMSERRWQQSLTLPAGTNPDKVDARYRNGVLELHLAKTEQSRGRRIDVKTS